MHNRLRRFSDMNVLVVDDEPANVALLTTLLADEGMHRVTGETDPRRVPGLLHEIDPDLVLLDLVMPQLSGLELLDVITRYAGGSYLPVLMLTADATARARNQALSGGAQDFLTKPLDLVEVVLRIANLLQTRQLFSLLRGSTGVAAATPEGPAEREILRRRIEGVLLDESIVPVYQPVVELASGRVVGHEALARFGEPHVRGPAGWFSDAFGVGLGVDLELLAARKALSFLQADSPENFLAINMSPATIQSLPRHPLWDLPVSSRIVIELTEHVPIEDYSAVHRAVAEVRAHGARLAADDIGSGYAGFRHLVTLGPDIIKLDISLVRHIHRSRSQRALASALVAFAADIDAQVIAEGVEEADERDVLAELGVLWAQGYFLGMPAPAW